MLGQLFIIIGCIISRTMQFCPQPCDCNDNLLSVSCSIQHPNRNHNRHHYSQQSQQKQQQQQQQQQPHQHHHQGVSSLDQIPIFLNPQVKSLDLHGNDIQDIGPSLQFYGQLVHLDISSNKLGSLGSSNFENLKSLQHLNLSDNQLTLLNNWSFKGLTSLLCLDLSANQIELIDDHAFNNLSKLEWINLSHNRLTYVDWTIFHGLGQLDNILLDHNFIEDYINKEFTWTLDKVSRLDLQFNRLQSHINFEPFANVKWINMAFNQISKIHESLFDYYNIQLLNLSNNVLTEIPGPLTKLGELSVIDFSTNNIQNVPSSSFQNLFKLTFIDLSNNPVSYIHPNALLDNINLVTFKLDNSQHLQYFDMNLLHSKPFLKLVSLKNCRLTHMDNLDVLMIKHLDLTGNPWNCNCSTVDMVNYIQQNRNKTNHHHPPLLTNVICSTPLKLQSVPISELDLTQFEDCFISDHFTNTVVLVTGLVLFLIIVVLAIKIYRVYRSKPDHTLHLHRPPTTTMMTTPTMTTTTMDIRRTHHNHHHHHQYDPHYHVYDNKQVPSVLV